jgi:hypothetical protein
MKKEKRRMENGEWGMLRHGLVWQSAHTQLLKKGEWGSA